MDSKPMPHHEMVCQINEEREANRREIQRLDALADCYKKQLPTVSPQWDCSISSIWKLDIDRSLLESGVALYKAPFLDIWNSLYKPSVYEANTLWGKEHNTRKIARVLEHWEKNEGLAPIFLKGMDEKDKGLVLDGKHRLTVCRALDVSLEIPFLVGLDDQGWASRNVKNALLQRCFSAQEFQDIKNRVRLEYS